MSTDKTVHCNLNVETFFQGLELFVKEEPMEGMYVDSM